MPKITNQNPPKAPPSKMKGSSKAALKNTSKHAMGVSPANMSKRNIPRSSWCPNKNIEVDPYCDDLNPKTITYKDVIKAEGVLKTKFSETPLMRSRCCKEFGIELHYKIESLHKTGSFNDRTAWYTLQSLHPDETKNGVVTASTGNWAMALAYQAKKLDIRCTVVMPAKTQMNIVEKCKEYEAECILLGKDFADAKKEAFSMASDSERLYINGYDHPNVIAASGTIGLEILDQLPGTDAILIPVGGGALIAGIAVAAKTVNPGIKIYGVEPDKACCFFKAMENDRPYNTVSNTTTAESLGIQMAGVNSFQTAKSLIDKMVLVDDDWISQAVLHYMEIEKLVVEGAGATALSPFLAKPTVLPELNNKKVVCVVTGGNIDSFLLPRCMERAKAVDGRLIKLKVTIQADDLKNILHVFSMISNVGCNVINFHVEEAWIQQNDLHKVFLHIICQNKDLEHACSFRRVMKQLFPDTCEFQEEPFTAVPICVCYPKKRVLK